MDLRKLKTLIELVETSGIAELEIQEGEERVRITRSQGASLSTLGAGQPILAVGAPASTPAATGTAPPVPPEPAPEQGHVVKSPMVGTFYRSATPGSKPFVEVGDAIEEGGTLCIVEAMKLMNEIKAELDAIVRRIYPKNADAVEYGQLLFELEPVTGPPAL